MKQITPIRIVLALALVGLILLSGRYGFTIVKIADEEKAVQNAAFDPAVYVDGIWASKLLPAYDEKAVDLSNILTEIQPDTNGTVAKNSLVPVAKKYGVITVGEAHIYIVKGKGKIVSVNTDTSLGTVQVSLDGYSGPIKVLLYVGSRIPSDETSVRDATDFISFGDFKEQTEYGKVGSEINKRILSQVLGSLDTKNMMGKTISFKGAYTIRTFNLVQIDLKEIKIVPMQIQLGE